MTGTRAPRRSTEEVQRLILEAARTLFERQGYQATTTAQIVERSAVDPPTLYRHFASKAALFEATVICSLREFIDRQVELWRSNPPGRGEPLELARHFVAGFYNALERHRDSLRLLLTATGDDDALGDLARAISNQFTEGLIALRQALVDETQAQGYQGLDTPEATIGAITGMIMALVLLDEWIFPAGTRPDKDTRINEAAAMMIHGFAHRPPPSATP